MERERERFSPLLLEPGEIYFEDYSATLSEGGENGEPEERAGRLKLCSKSIVFESHRRSEPLVKIRFRDCSLIERAPSGSRVSVSCSQRCLMLADNAIAPYAFVRDPAEFHFALDYGSASDCAERMNQLKRANSLPACEQSAMIAAICHSRYSRIEFDPLWLDDIYDPVLLEVDADKITPLVRNPGKVVLTAKTLFFQPCNDIETYPVLKVDLGKIKKIYKRRFLLKQTGLEMYSENSDVPHLYLCFRREIDRDDAHSKIVSQPMLNLDDVDRSEMTMKWQNGVISNYDYLDYLNCLADRTKTDLTQYPVFPWVLNDYISPEIDLEDADSYRDLSKPIGALNEERLQRLKERYDEMAPPRFLYGSHYSAPGLVLFYLVRIYPQYMLCLQNGRFDHPDRMFNSVSDVYKNCLRNMSDFKELIPEFYDVNNEGDFLVNKFGINFGYKHDSTKVDDVELPAWAKSPKHFIETMRNALESDIVSRNLHKWIDLIFGYKQRGIEAEKAFNVFYHLCYEGTVDLDDVEDMNDRHALEVQIMEFGQIPKQIFQTPHVRKIPIKVARPIAHPECDDDETVEPTIEGTSNVRQLETLFSFDSHRDIVSSVLISSDKSFAVSVGHDGLLKMYNLLEKRQSMSVRLGSMPLSSCVQIFENLVAIGSWNNDIVLYDLEYGRINDTFRAHNNSVDVLLWSPKEKMLISGGQDCVANVWTLSQIERSSSRSKFKLIASFDHDSKITSLATNKNFSLLLVGTEDGEIYLWDLPTKSLKRNLLKHNSAITGSAFIWHDKRLIITSADGELRVTDMSMNCQVLTKLLPEGISSLTWNGDRNLYLSGAGGTLFVWDLQTVQQILQIKIFQESVSCITVAEDSSYILCGSSDHQVKLFSPKRH